MPSHALDVGISGFRARTTVLLSETETTMRPRRLEIELSDDFLSRIDRACALSGRSRGKVIADTLEDHLPSGVSPASSAVDERLAFLKAVVDRAENLGRQRTQVDMDAELAAIRGDRGHGR